MGFSYYGFDFMGYGLVVIGTIITLFAQFFYRIVISNIKEYKMKKRLLVLKLHVKFWMKMDWERYMLPKLQEF